MIAHKIELKPTNKQITYFKKPSGMSLKKEFNSLKKEHFPFTYDVTKYASQQPFIQLQEAYNQFFKKVSDRPKFKKKGESKDSFYIGGDQIKITDNRVRIPNLGYVKLKEKLRFDGKIINATVSRIADKWFISFGVKLSTSYSKTCKNQASIGIDLGIKTLATFSNGTFFQSPKPLKKYLKKLKRVQRQLSKKVHKKIADIRHNSLHKLTTFLTDNFKFIAIEDLNVKGMMKNSKLSKAISDMGFYEFKRQLQYKAKIKGNYIHIVDMWFPSSKTCANCENKKEKLSLSERTYICEKCELEIDRDLNASINLHNQLPTVHREVKPLEIQALNLKAGLSDLTSVVELGNKHQKQLAISSFE